MSAPESAPDGVWEFSGERAIVADGAWVWDNLALEHVARYLLARPLVAGRRVLDCACGTGYGTAILARTATSVVGVDVARASIERAARDWPAPNVEHRVGDVLALPFADASFDAVVSFETIEHVATPERALDELRRVLRPGGIAIVSTPDREVYRWADHRADGGNPFHLKELSRDEFRAALASRFRIRALYGQRPVPDFPRDGVVATPDPGAAEPPTTRPPALRDRLRPLVRLVTTPLLRTPLAEPLARRLRPGFFPVPLDARPFKYVVAVVERPPDDEPAG